MQISIKRAMGAAVMALAVMAALPAQAQLSARHQDASPDGSVMQISGKQNFPITKKITLGVGRSMMMQFPMELRDVMIADPSKVDAIVQSSDRVFLVARGAGSTNAFFFDANGNQVMTLEIAIGSDLSALDNLLKRLIPSSNIRTDLAGTAIVLMGSVRTPGDAATRCRHCDAVRICQQKPDRHRLVVDIDNGRRRNNLEQHLQQRPRWLVG